MSRYIIINTGAKTRNDLDPLVLFFIIHFVRIDLASCTKNYSTVAYSYFSLFSLLTSLPSAHFCFAQHADLSTYLQYGRSVTYLRPSVLVLCKPAGVFEQQDLVILEAVDVEGPQKLTQPPRHRRQSLGREDEDAEARQLAGQMVNCRTYREDVLFLSR